MVRPDRAELLIRWILANRDVVNKPKNIQITFNCSGQTANVEIKERQEIPVTDLARK